MEPAPNSLPDDPTISYYVRKRNHSIEKVCPFADPDRENPCTSHHEPRKRKDAIMKHLQKKKVNPDVAHPANDPLWNSDIVEYLIQPRPRYDDNKKKEGQKVSR